MSISNTSGGKKRSSTFIKDTAARAALTAVVISYLPKSVLRDAGTALGVDLSIVDKIAKASHGWAVVRNWRSVCTAVDLIQSPRSPKVGLPC